MKKCKNCGIEIDENHTYCPLCGMSLDDVEYGDNGLINNDLLVDAFIGDKASVIKNSKFSIWTFVFSCFYILYRKMWLYALIWFIISILCMFLPIVLGLTILISLNVVGAIFFSKIYLNYSKKQVSKIRNDNKSLNQDGLISICKVKGGTSYVGLIIVFAVIILIVCISLLISMYKSKNLKNNNIDDKTQSFYNLNYIIPDIFIDNSTIKNEDTKVYELDKSIDSECYIYLSKFKSNTFSDINNVFDKTITKRPGDVYSEVGNNFINGKNFSYMTVTNGNMFDSYYVNNESNTTYLIHYSIVYDKDNKCKSEYTNFISSLSIKE